MSQYVANLEPIEEEIVPDLEVEHVWDPDEGQLAVHHKPKPCEYVMRKINGVLTPFPQEHVIFTTPRQSSRLFDFEDGWMFSRPMFFADPFSRPQKSRP